MARARPVRPFLNIVLSGWLAPALVLLQIVLLQPARAAEPVATERGGVQRREDPLSVAGQLQQEPAAGLLVLAYHDIRDDVAARGDPDPHATSTRNFVAQLDWLSGHGYVPVSLDDVIAASRGQRPLPDKAVLLTFDDGLRSHYTRVFPLLRAYGWPAVMSVVTSWVDLPAAGSVEYGPRAFGRDDFLTWEQLRQMQASGLVEVASHSHALHRGVRANPQGNMTPAANTRIHDPVRNRYESESEWRARIGTDLRTSAALIERELGVRPRAITWPYGAYNDAANALADAAGMPISFDLYGRRQTIPPAGAAPGELHGLARLLLSDNADVSDLAFELRRELTLDGVRAVQVDLDDVYDADPAQTERNLDRLVQRLYQLGPSHVFLQAFADPDGDGAADALYFPNRHLPMRADLFNRVAWQIKTRAGVKVFAWMPVLGLLPPDAARRQRLLLPASGDREIPRLDPANPAARALIGDVYEDLAAASYFEGLLFHDDAYLREHEAAAFGTVPAARTDQLIAFTQELEQRVERWRPRLTTVRNLYARPVLDPASEARFAQRLDAFLAAYDYTALMAMPWLEGARAPDAWLQQVAAAVAARPRGLEGTIFELQTFDWRTGTAIPGERIAAQMRQLQATGAGHLAYYPDDFIRDQPALVPARAAISARRFPFPPR